MSILDDKPLERVIQESVPGKQITLAHVLASPASDIYAKIDIDELGAIGILTLSPCEAAIIAADIATKAADVNIGFLDRFTGSVVVSGDVQSVETALLRVTEVLGVQMGFATVNVTRT
ncbi:MAG: BMC domain-containing protein [Clostridiales Family XIII bacterium]|jgi:ethanolamine utilization protein EutS|nr:BMC domain-containing protein [Clostridiales Family XIII bacterium]